eukprot:209219_1
MATFSALFMIYMVLLSATIATHPTENWFSFPITDQSHDATQLVISNAKTQLSQNGVFHLPNFLSPIAMRYLRTEIHQLLSAQGISDPSYRSHLASTNIFGDDGDDQYKKRHPRNSKHALRVTGVPRYQLPDIVIHLYEYEPLIEFMKTVVTSTKHELPLCDPWQYDCKQWNDLHIGTTKEVTSVFLQTHAKVLQDGDFMNYHLIEEGLTCSFVIDGAWVGGDVQYKFVAPKVMIGNDVKWNWKLIKKVLKEDVEVNSFVPQASDMYCVKGNITLHRINDVEGDNTRVDLVMSYYGENPGLTGPVQAMHYYEL